MLHETQRSLHPKIAILKYSYICSLLDNHTIASAMFIRTPLLLKKSIKSCLQRNVTAGDCVRLATLDIDAEEGVGAEDPDGVEGVEEVDGVGGVDEEDGVDGVDAACDGDAAEDGLDEAAPVSELPPALDSPVV